MNDPNAYINVSMTGTQALEVRSLIEAELRNTGRCRPTSTLTKRRMLLKQATKALQDSLEETDWRSDGSGQFAADL